MQGASATAPARPGLFEDLTLPHRSQTTSSRRRERSAEHGRTSRLAPFHKHYLNTSAALLTAVEVTLNERIYTGRTGSGTQGMMRSRRRYRLSSLTVTFHAWLTDWQVNRLFSAQDHTLTYNIVSACLYDSKSDRNLCITTCWTRSSPHPLDIRVW